MRIELKTTINPNTYTPWLTILVNGRKLDSGISFEAMEIPKIYQGVDVMHELKGVMAYGIEHDKNFPQTPERAQKIAEHVIDALFNDHSKLKQAVDLPDEFSGEPAQVITHELHALREDQPLKVE